MHRLKRRWIAYATHLVRQMLSLSSLETFELSQTSAFGLNASFVFSRTLTQPSRKIVSLVSARMYSCRHHHRTCKHRKDQAPTFPAHYASHKQLNVWFSKAYPYIWTHVASHAHVAWLPRATTKFVLKKKYALPWVSRGFGPRWWVLYHICGIRWLSVWETLVRHTIFSHLPPLQRGFQSDSRCIVISHNLGFRASKQPAWGHITPVVTFGVIFHRRLWLSGKAKTIRATNQLIRATRIESIDSPPNRKAQRELVNYFLSVRMVPACTGDFIRRIGILY